MNSILEKYLFTKRSEKLELDIDQYHQESA